MKHFWSVLLMLSFIGFNFAYSQVSADCANAIPICNDTPVNGGTTGAGIDDFNGSISGCLEQAISGTIESNSAWYRFRTGASGQLGFNIGQDTSEDWDFALYKSNDCSNLGEPVRCNFFDNQDQNSFIGIGGDPTGDMANVQYDAWLDVLPGEDYYLLINNFSNNNSGFSIQFSGHIFVTNPYDALDCSIISNLLGPPISACENDTIVLDATTTSALTYNWFMDTGTGFQSIIGQHNPTLQAQTSALYRAEVVMPTLNNIISDVQVAFSMVPQSFTVSDDASCSGMASYDLSLKDMEILGNQSPNEFIVTYHNSHVDANSASNALPKQYAMSFGTKTIYTRVTSLKNAKCFDVSESFQLTALETPAINFEREAYLCENNGSITIGETEPNGNYSYLWNSGETTSSIVVTQPGSYALTITNSQSGLSCSSTADINVVVSRPPRITDIIIGDLQKSNTVEVVVEGDGPFEYMLDEEGFKSSGRWNNVAPGRHTITVNDPKGCGMVREEIVVVGFPKFFTPNGDTIGDYWNIEGISNLDNPIVDIFDRYGKLLKRLNSQSLGWDGTFNGKNLPASDYWFKLSYEKEDGQRTTAKYVNNHFSLKR